jgi:hypothetical protein
MLRLKSPCYDFFQNYVDFAFLQINHGVHDVYDVRVHEFES